MKDTLTCFGMRHKENHDLQGTHLIKIARESLKMDLPISFNRNFLKNGYKAAERETPINEIEFIPITETVPKKHAHIFGARKPWTGDLKSYAVALKESIKIHLRTVLNPKSKTLFSHSAGYDSRIISHCLRELVDEGFDPGRIIFICHQPENELFHKIMKRQQWPDDGRFTFADDSKLNAADHYDIGRTDQPVNGWNPVTMQMNWWRHIIKNGEEKKWNFLSGLGGGEMFNYPAIGMKLFRSWSWCENDFLNRYLNHFLYNHEWAGDLNHRFKSLIIPYFSYDYLEIAGQCPDKFIGLVARPDGRTDMVRAAIMDTFGNSTYDLPYGPGHRYEWKVTPKRVKAMQEFWQGCKFRKDVAGLPAAINPIQSNPNGTQKIDTHDSRLFAFAVTYEQIFK